MIESSECQFRNGTHKQWRSQDFSTGGATRWSGGATRKSEATVGGGVIILDQSPSLLTPINGGGGMAPCAPLATPVHINKLPET